MKYKMPNLIANSPTVDSLKSYTFTVFIFSIACHLATTWIFYFISPNIYSVFRNF